jgi:hypothetical protein
MTVRTVIGRRAVLCAVVVTLCLPAGRSVAGDAPASGEVAKPSLEELAVPNKTDDKKDESKS